MRLHIVLDDAGSFNIGQCAFKRSGYFDAHTPVVFGYHHQDAVADVHAEGFYILNSQGTRAPAMIANDTAAPCRAAPRRSCV